MDKATPRPWRVGFCHNGLAAIYGTDTCEGPVALLLAKPDARLIVRAVNAHEKLVEACKAALAELPQFPNETCAYEKCKEALKLAGEHDES